MLTFGQLVGTKVNEVILLVFFFSFLFLQNEETNRFHTR